MFHLILFIFKKWVEVLCRLLVFHLQLFRLAKGADVAGSSQLPAVSFLVVALIV